MWVGETFIMFFQCGKAGLATRTQRKAFLFYKAREIPGLHSLGNEWSPTQKKCSVKIGFWLAGVSEKF